MLQKDSGVYTIGLQHGWRSLELWLCNFNDGEMMLNDGTVSRYGAGVSVEQFTIIRNSERQLIFRGKSNKNQFCKITFEA